jgi:hypothetical protein
MTMMHSVVLYGLRNEILEYKQHRAATWHRLSSSSNEHLVAFERFVNKIDQNVQTYKILIDTNSKPEDDYSCFCYLNYGSETDALNGKQIFEEAISRARTIISASVDTSHMVVCMKSEAPKRRWSPVFSIWVGNLFDADTAEVKARFNRFGRLATMATHGLPPFKLVGGTQRSAILNYVHFAGAKAAIDACGVSAIAFGPPSSAPAVARPRANAQFIQRVLAILEAQGKPIPVEHIHRIADSMREERPADCVALLRACPDLFRVDPATLSVAASATAPTLRPPLPPPPPLRDAAAVAAAAAEAGGGGECTAG